LTPRTFKDAYQAALRTIARECGQCDAIHVFAAVPAPVAVFCGRELLPKVDPVPFASAHALFNLSKLAVWWLRLGIGIERIKPGHPQQNGRHERMHLTLKKETTKPAGSNFLQQQARFDDFIEIFNNERPHQALDMKCPVEVYQPSTRPYTFYPSL
jgi:transposase InsO family protein